MNLRFSLELSSNSGRPALQRWILESDGESVRPASPTVSCSLETRSMLSYILKSEGVLVGAWIWGFDGFSVKGMTIFLGLYGLLSAAWLDSRDIVWCGDSEDAM